MEKIFVRCKAKQVGSNTWVEGYPRYSKGSEVPTHLIDEDTEFNDIAEYDIIPSTICRMSPWTVGDKELCEHDIVITKFGKAVVKYGTYYLHELLDADSVVDESICTRGFYLEYNKNVMGMIDFDILTSAEIFGNEFDSDETPISPVEAIHILTYGLITNDSKLIDARKAAIKALGLMDKNAEAPEIDIHNIQKYIGKPIYIMYGDEGQWDIVVSISDNYVKLLSKDSVTIDTYGTAWVAFEKEPFETVE